ncbi:type I restriction endonuclease [Chitinophaga horti]|uniref:Type I restriction endonuclease n=1 Tax=Chitinophaga horti TaxID=2920382 RepID=A0ABY6J2D7_9BACT|nr:type I restriction endonuclease [Chitinophaga horti]UYQ92312.1 type I restriction endonuclease [Chitinophaga horti]
MDFKDVIRQLGERALKIKDAVLTEEATKNAFIMPFIQALGYDVFNPAEVTPEFVADLGIKQGEKVDYAVFKDQKLIMLIECKWHRHALDVFNSQLFRYFHTTNAKFGLLTNGFEYRFYTDLQEPNKMDEKPFFTFNITDIRDNQIEELKKFHKAYYDLETIVTTASELKYTNELRALIHAELNNPSENFVRHFARQIYGGVLTAKVTDQFSQLTKKSVQHYINDLITDRLKTALTSETPGPAPTGDGELVAEIKDAKVVTTAEELEAFYIIKSILRHKIDGERIVYRDAQSYFAVLLDDNNRKTICRLYLSGSKKHIGLMDENKKETKHEIRKIDDIYKLDVSLTKAIDRFEASVGQAEV